MPGSYRTADAMMALPPGRGIPGASPSRAEVTCVHGIPAKMCGVCLVAVPRATSFTEGPPQQQTRAEVTAAKMQHDDAYGALSPSEVHRRAERALRDLAPPPARGYEQEQRYKYRPPELSDSESESSSESDEAPIPPPQPRRYWQPPPAPVRPNVYIRQTRTPPTSVRDAGVQVVQMEATTTQTFESSVAAPTPTPPVPYSPAPTSEVVVTPAPSTPAPTPPTPQQPAILQIVQPERSVFMREVAPLTLPPSPYVATPQKRCGHAERVAKRRAQAEAAEREAATQRATAAVAAADQEERRAQLRAVQASQEQQRSMLQQVNTERMLAEQAAVYAVSQREAAEACLQQLQLRQTRQANDLSDAVGQVQQSAHLAHRERVAAEHAAVTAAAKRAELDTAVTQVEGARHNTDRKMAEMQHGNRQTVHTIAQSATEAKSDRIRAELAVQQAGNLVDAALKILSTAPLPEAQQAAPAPQQTNSIHARGMSPKRKKQGHAAPAPIPPQHTHLQPTHDDDVSHVSSVSKQFTADMSNPSDGPSPPSEGDDDAPVFHPSVSTSLPSLHPYCLGTSSNFSESIPVDAGHGPLERTGTKDTLMTSPQNDASAVHSTKTSMVSAQQSAPLAPAASLPTAMSTAVGTAVPGSAAFGHPSLPPELAKLLQHVQQLALNSVPHDLPQHPNPVGKDSSVGVRAEQSAQHASLPPADYAVGNIDVGSDYSALEPNDLLDIVSAVTTLQNSRGNASPRGHNHGNEREESPPPAGHSFSPPISPSAVERSRVELERQGKDQDEVESLLQSALVMVKAAEAEKHQATQKAAAMESRANQLQARLAELGAEYTVGDLQGELLSNAPSAATDVRIPAHMPVVPANMPQGPLVALPGGDAEDTRATLRSDKRTISPSRRPPLATRPRTTHTASEVRQWGV